MVMEADQPVRQIPLTCPGHSRPVVDLEYTDMTPDGFFLVSACKDGKPMIREGSTGDWIGTFIGHKGAVWGTAIDRRGLKVATGSADFSAKLWDAITGDDLYTFNHPHIVRTVCFSSDGQKLLTGCQDKKIRMFDVANPEMDPVILTGHAKPLRVVIFGTKAGQVISSADEPNIRVWDLATGECVRTLETTCAVLSLELSRDEKDALRRFVDRARADADPPLQPPPPSSAPARDPLLARRRRPGGRAVPPESDVRVDQVASEA